MLVSDALRHLVSTGTGSPEAQLGPSAVFLAPASSLLMAVQQSPLPSMKMHPQIGVRGVGKALLWCSNSG